MAGRHEGPAYPSNIVTVESDHEQNCRDYGL
jgi:hypothetical protein